MGHVVNSDDSRNITQRAEGSTQVPYTSQGSSSLVRYRIPEKCGVREHPQIPDFLSKVETAILRDKNQPF